MAHDHHFRGKSPSEIAAYHDMARESQSFFFWGAVIALVVGIMLFAFAWFAVWTHATS